MVIGGRIFPDCGRESLANDAIQHLSGDLLADAGIGILQGFALGEQGQGAELLQSIPEGAQGVSEIQGVSLIHQRAHL